MFLFVIKAQARTFVMFTNNKITNVMTRDSHVLTSINTVPSQVTSVRCQSANYVLSRNVT